MGPDTPTRRAAPTPELSPQGSRAADETRARAVALLAQYDAALEEYTALTEDPDAREKHVQEALWAVDEMVSDLAEALRKLLA